MRNNPPEDPYLDALNDATRGKLIQGGLTWKPDPCGYISFVATHQIADPLIEVIRQAAQESSLDPSRIRFEYLQGGMVTEDHRKNLKPTEGIMGNIVIPEDYAFNGNFIAALDRHNEELEQTRFNSAHSFVDGIMKQVKNPGPEPTP
jgi:hypothetical protein